MEKLKLTSSARARSRAATFVGDLIKLAVMLAFVFPFYWMVITAFKPYVESMDVPPTFWPQTWTLEGFRSTFSAGLDIPHFMIETDVRMTKDRELVIMHDPTVDRTTDGTGLVHEMTLAQFKALDAAADFEDFPREAPPTLEEFLKLCARRDNMLIDFELKEYPVEGNEAVAYECADRTIQMLEEYGFGERCVLNSFNGKLLEQDRSYR